VLQYPGGIVLLSRFDAQWRVKALAGDADAIRLLAEDALQPLYSFCLYRVGKRTHLCEEVVQETMLRAIKELDRYDPRRAEGDIFPWLTGLARNEIQRVLTREKPILPLEALWTRMDKDMAAIYEKLDHQLFDEEVLKREETRELVNATMSQLPPHYRETLEAKYLRGKSVRDIAVLLSVSEKAVESQLTRARDAFRGTFLALARNLEVENPAISAARI
jgi:RNA polymerase sigma-70 factor, ECF subfamily